MVKHGDFPTDILDKHEQMSLVVSEYLGKAKNLIAYASAEGWFPCADNHEWVERNTRAQHARYWTDWFAGLEHPRNKTLTNVYKRFLLTPSMLRFASGFALLKPRF